MDRSTLDAALKYLSSRPRSVREVRAKLRERGATQADIDEVVDYLVDQGLLNDRALAEQMTRFRAGERFWGPGRVAQDLRRRGIDGTIAGSVLAEIYEEYPEAELLNGAIEKWTRKRGVPTTPRELKNLYDRLRRSGFAPAQIRSQLSSLFKNIDWDDAL